MILPAENQMKIKIEESSGYNRLDQKEQSMNKILKGGILGAGKNSFIGYVHIAAASLNREAEIVAGVFSKFPEKSITRGDELNIKEERSYPDYKVMIEKELSLPPEERIDFVIVATPNSSHYDISLAFLKAGIHVFSDKPMAISLKQAIEIKETAEKNNLVFVLTHGYTGYPMIKQARYIVQSGDIGRVVRIVVEYTQGWLSSLIEDPDIFKTWHLDPDISGPSCTMMDVGIHALNLVQTIAGIIPHEVCADLVASIPGNPLDDAGSVLIHFADDVHGILHASQISTGEGNALRIKVYGTSGGLSWDQEYPETLEKLNPDGTSTVYKKGSKALCDDAKMATNLPGGHPEGLICAFANIYKAGFKAMRCIANNKKTCIGGKLGWDYPDADQGVIGLAFIESIIKNNKSDKKWTTLEF